jgi:hypothetical protein
MSEAVSSPAPVEAAGRRSAARTRRKPSPAAPAEERPRPDGLEGLEELSAGLQRLMRRYLEVVEEVSDQTALERSLRVLGLLAYHYGRLLMTQRELAQDQEGGDPLLAALAELEEEMGWKR